jgi:hypothetical protein
MPFESAVWNLIPGEFGKRMNDSKRYENTLIAILFFSWGALFLDRTALHSLAPYFVPEFHLSHQQVGMLGAVLAVTLALSALFLKETHLARAGSPVLQGAPAD